MKTLITMVAFLLVICSGVSFGQEESAGLKGLDLGSGGRFRLIANSNCIEPDEYSVYVFPSDAVTDSGSVDFCIAYDDVEKTFHYFGIKGEYLSLSSQTTAGACTGFDHQTSTDLKTWTRKADLELYDSTYAVTNAFAPNLIKYGGEWFLFYTAVNNVTGSKDSIQQIVVRHSADLYAWSDPILVFRADDFEPGTSDFTQNTYDPVTDWRTSCRDAAVIRNEADDGWLMYVCVYSDWTSVAGINAGNIVAVARSSTLTGRFQIFDMVSESGRIVDGYDSAAESPWVFKTGDTYYVGWTSDVWSVTYPFRGGGYVTSTTPSLGSYTPTHNQVYSAGVEFSFKAAEPIPTDDPDVMPFGFLENNPGVVGDFYQMGLLRFEHTPGEYKNNTNPRCYDFITPRDPGPIFSQLDIGHPAYFGMDLSSHGTDYEPDYDAYADYDVFVNHIHLLRETSPVSPETEFIGFVDSVRVRNPDFVNLIYLSTNTIRPEWSSTSYGVLHRLQAMVDTMDTHYINAGGPGTWLRQDDGTKCYSYALSPDMPMLNPWAVEYGLADSLVSIYMDAINSTSNDREYTGFFLDWFADQFPGWGIRKGENVDMDQDGVWSMQVTAGGVTERDSTENVKETAKYHEFSQKFLDRLQAEFDERGMENRIVLCNGNYPAENAEGALKSCGHYYEHALVAEASINNKAGWDDLISTPQTERYRTDVIFPPLNVMDLQGPADSSNGFFMLPWAMAMNAPVMLTTGLANDGRSLVSGTIYDMPADRRLPPAGNVVSRSIHELVATAGDGKVYGDTIVVVCDSMTFYGVAQLDTIGSDQNSMDIKAPWPYLVLSADGDTLMAGGGWRTDPGIDINSIDVANSQRLGVAFPGNADAFEWGILDEIGVGIVSANLLWSGGYTHIGGNSAAWLDSLSTYGMTACLVLCPDYASGFVEEGSGTARDGMYLASQAGAWYSYMVAIAEMVDGDGNGDAEQLGVPIHDYMLLNEWTGHDNASGGWRGNWSNIGNLIALTKAGLSASDPDYRLTLGAPSGIAQDMMLLCDGSVSYEVKNDLGTYTQPDDCVAYMDSLLDVITAAENSDIGISVHQYGPLEHNLAREAWDDSLGFTFDEITVTEAGGPSLNYDAAPDTVDYFNYAWHINLDAFKNSIPFVLWLNLFDSGDYPVGNESAGNDNVPFLLTDGSSITGYRPQWYAYKMLALCFEDALTCTRMEEGVYRVALAGGENIYMMLAGFGDGSYTMPAGSAPVQSIKVSDVAGGKYVFDPVPVAGDLIDHSTFPMIVSEKMLIN